MFRPRKLDIFIIKQFLLLFVGAFLICQFVLMMQFLWKYIDDLVGKGLTISVLGQFFWYMGLMLVPQALPLAILLSSLITFGNLSESSELTAIKAAGIPLMKVLRPVFLFVLLVCGGSFYFQNNIGPKANLKIAQLILSMRQKSPELQIPEGIFYDGIPQSNIYVQKKNLETGKLYGLTIYRLTGSYEDQAIILADSGMLQSTADKKHLLLTLWNGDWFENMQSQELGNKASVPYRHETFYHKQILIDYDDDFNMTDASILANDARAKGLKTLLHDIDSLNAQSDSIARGLYAEMKHRFYVTSSYNTSKDSTAKKKQVAAKTLNFDSIYSKLSDDKKKAMVGRTSSYVANVRSDMSFRSEMADNSEKLIRRHKIEAIAKFTLAFSCIIFFFIGAPLGAIIRKGGLGLPVIISVLIFIVYYILENSGTRMVRIGAYNLWFGCLLSTAVLTPLAAFFTYKANNDSAVFNMDLYKEFFQRLFGIRNKRHIFAKEVIINDPDYQNDASMLADINNAITEYAHQHKLRHAPNIIKVFFKYEPDHSIEQISEQLETVIEDLSNTRDKFILTEINHYPIMAVKAHTRPFNTKWKNIVAAIILPFGLFLYFRMWRFRIRLYRDLVVIKDTNNKMIQRINEKF